VDPSFWAAHRAQAALLLRVSAVVEAAALSAAEEPPGPEAPPRWQAPEGRSQLAGPPRQVGRPEPAVMRRPGAPLWQAPEGRSQPAGRLPQVGRLEPEVARAAALGAPAVDKAARAQSKPGPIRAVHARSAQAPGAPRRAIWSRYWASWEWLSTDDAGGGASESRETIQVSPGPRAVNARC